MFSLSLIMWISLIQLEFWNISSNYCLRRDKVARGRRTSPKEGRKTSRMTSGTVQPLFCPWSCPVSCCAALSLIGHRSGRRRHEQYSDDWALLSACQTQTSTICVGLSDIRSGEKGECRKRKYSCRGRLSITFSVLSARHCCGST